jgi:hypothetical protein
MTAAIWDKAPVLIVSIGLADFIVPFIMFEGWDLR